MIYIILGTKGQFMKMFPVMKLFDKYKVPYKFIHTGQHFGIIEANIKRFKVRRPDVYLTIKKEDLKNIKEMFFWMPKVLWNARKLKIKKTDWVLIHADTESTLLAVIIAKFFRAKTAHVESGVRSHNWLEPFPEEIIRAIADYTCDINFCPYENDAQNIKKKTGKYITYGNTVFDSVRYALRERASEKINKLKNKPYAIFLIHRKENVLIKRRFESIIDTLEEILRRGFRVIWPVHATTRFELKKHNLWDRVVFLQSKYDLILDYFFDYVDFMHLIKNCEFIASDGGGVQKETYYLNKPMLILRKTTEDEPGVGENSYLAHLEKDKINYFLDNYKKFKRKPFVKRSPSEVIVNYFINSKN